MSGALDHPCGSYELGGLRISDPYLWLESESAETAAWEDEQDARTRRMLANIRASELAGPVEPHLNALWRLAPRSGGGRWFRISREDGELVCSVAGSPAGPWRVLVDPPACGYASIEWISPSPSGALLACGLVPPGGAESELRVVNVEDGGLLPDRIPFASACRPAWLPDESGLYYSAGQGGSQLRQRLCFHRLGEAVRAPEPIPPPPDGFVLPQIAADGSAVVALTGFASPRPFFLREGEGDWRPFLDGFDGMALGVLEPGAYLAVAVTADVPNGHVVSIPLDAGADDSAWVEIVPESETVLRSVGRVAGRLVVSGILDGEARLQVFSDEGEFLDEAALPPKGAIGADGLSWSHAPLEEQFVAGEREVVFVHSSYSRSPSLWRYDVAELRLDELEPPLFDRQGLVVERRSFDSTDGGEVPLWLVHRDDVDPATPRACVIYGYGGSNNAFLPVYLGPLAAFVEAGGLVAFPSIRGGGERGWDWYQQGRLRHKQHCFDDLRAVAAGLVETGVTRRDILGLVGVSAGGLLVGASVVQEPEMCAAAVLIVPLLDLLRTGDGAFDDYSVTEHGDPTDPDTAALIAAYAPYNNVRPADYPSLLVISGEEDTACPPRHASKFVARVQEATTSGEPVYFRKWPGAGHLAGEVPTAEQGAEWVAFLMAELGLTPGAR